jgi:ABC-type transport system involved in multi-copper enzyme maturation permease subunit
MFRLTWRQFRTPAAVVLCALVVFAAFAAVTGPGLAHAYRTAMAACRPSGDCSSATASFLQTYAVLNNAFGTLIAVVPALLGVFWGAPLIAREIESGTFPLVWTQSVTRTRWLAVKLAVVGGATMLAAGLLSLIVTWWARPLDRAGAHAFETFSARDITPIGYAAFAFALGVAIGMLIRRSVPAMALTLFVFVVVRISTTFGVRPRLIGPAHQALALDPASTGMGSEVSPSILLNSLFNGGPSSALEPATPVMPNAWIYSARVVDGSGHDLTDAVLNADCPNLGSGGGGPAVGGHSEVPEAAQNAMQACVTKVGATYHELITYQPANRYWTLQWEEFALYGAAAVLLAAFCVWWVRRRRIA